MLSAAPVLVSFFSVEGGRRDSPNAPQNTGRCRSRGRWIQAVSEKMKTDEQPGVRGRPGWLSVRPSVCLPVCLGALLPGCLCHTQCNSESLSSLSSTLICYQSTPKNSP